MGNRIKNLSLALLFAFASLFFSPAAHATFTPQLTPAEVLSQGGGFFLRAPQYVVRVELAANVEQHFNLHNGFGIPGSGATTAGVMSYPVFAVFVSDTGNFYVGYYNTATVPAGSNIVDGSAADFNPNQRYIGTDILNVSLISPVATKLTILFFKP